MVNEIIIMQIYKITNLINNKIYIGKDTTSDPNYFGSGLLIKRAISKYGINNFIKEVIDETDDYLELSKKEIYWISEYDSTKRDIGYNISTGGDGGDTLSNHPELNLIKEKISKNNPKTGKTYEEAFGKDKASEYKKKLKKNIDTRIRNFKYLTIFFSKFNSFINLPITNLNARTGWLAFPLTIKENKKFNRRDMQIFFEKNNIQTRTIFTGNILRQPAMNNLKYKSKKDSAIISNNVMKNGILLGCHHGMNVQDLDYICETFIKFLKFKKVNLYK